MELPLGFEDVFGQKKVCKLKKSLYGLNQSPRAWFKKFTKSIHRFEYTQSQGDHTLFFKHSKNGSITILIVYVDDNIVTGNDANEIEKLKRMLAEEFKIKDLGIEVSRSKKGIFLSQIKYVLDLFKET